MDVRTLEKRFKKWRNLKYMFTYKDLTGRPSSKLAILTCMDCRIISEVFGIEEPGEVTIIRNAGALFTKDSLRSVLVAIYELGVDTLAVVGHTGCGGSMTNADMEKLLDTISQASNYSSDKVLELLEASSAAEFFMGFEDVREQVRQTVKLFANNPLIAPKAKVYGFIYNTKTGDIERVERTSIA
ncbi:MAG: beta-class carbonic anhydrase [Candidatus Hodarchaeales archaeon]